MISIFIKICVYKNSFFSQTKQAESIKNIDM